jgi:uncharacterized membrane protein
MRLRSPYPALLAATALACALLAVRVLRTERLSYAFLPYNLALAWAPMGLAALTGRLSRAGAWTAAPAAIAWWLFFPNAFYVVTDFVHLRERPGVPLWYDIALTVAFAWCGTLLALASLARMHAIVRARFGALLGWAFALFACLSSGFGIWLGRVQRYNSWDAALHPLWVARDAARAVVHPLRMASAWGVTLAFGGLLAVLYLSTNAWSAGVSPAGRRRPAGW